MSTNAERLGVTDASVSYADTSSPGLLPDQDREDGDEELRYEQPPPGPPLGERHVNVKKPTPLTDQQKEECAKSLRSSSLFQFCSDESIAKVVHHMRREEFTEGEVR